MNPDRHLILIGLMGAGKTTVGEECARRLGRGFVDTDQVVEANAGESVAAIFDREGEIGFRVRERAALAAALAGPEPLVIACGGGAMVDGANRRDARAAGVVVWLQAPPEVLTTRVRQDGIGARPLLANGPTTVTLTRMADARAEAYGAAAHVAVDTQGKTVDGVAHDVLAAFAAESGGGGFGEVAP